jgi:hypothetical protein
MAIPVKGGGGGSPDFTAETWILAALAIAAAIVSLERLRPSSTANTSGDGRFLSQRLSWG